MANVFDLAKYILSITGEITTMKLQKLVYYSQAWAVTLEKEPIFEEEVLAWTDGPVVKDLFYQHKGWWYIELALLPFGEPDNLTPKQKSIVNLVVGKYGGHSAEELSELTHSEPPWRNAKDVITPLAMAKYYSTLPPINKFEPTQEMVAYGTELLRQIDPSRVAN